MEKDKGNRRWKGNRKTHVAWVPQIWILTEVCEGLDERKFWVLFLLLTKASVPFRGHFLGPPVCIGARPFEGSKFPSFWEGSQWERLPRRTRTMWPGQRKTELPGSSRVTHWRFPETWKALLGWLRGNTSAPVNQSGLKGKEMKVTGKKTEESSLQSYWGGGGQETMISVLFQPLCAWHSARKLSCWGHMHLWPDPFHAPLILTQESSFGRHPNGF